VRNTIGVLLVLAVTACSNQERVTDPQCSTLDAEPGQRCAPIGMSCVNVIGPIPRCKCSSDAGWVCTGGPVTPDF